MSRPAPLQIQRVSVFMPHRLSDDEVERLFSMRLDVFQTLLDSLRSEKANSIPQHHLLVGQRGMGKTTMLKRLDVELRRPPLNKKFIPFTFPEEQYNIDRLSKFWLNSLDALADTLQNEGDEAGAFDLDKQIAALSTIRDEQKLSEDAYTTLVSRSKALKRRPVFLLDNLNLIFDRLGELQQSKLRKLITEPGAPIFIGATPEVADDDLQYDAPFYDAFAVHFLLKLSFPQTLQMLRHLAEVTDQQTLLSQLTPENRPRLETLHQLTGGNVRTVVILFALIAQGFSADVFQDLEALIDQMTPLYKSRFEELSPQAQVVVDAVALNWDPCRLETLRDRTSLENSQLSAQLDRLVKAGWLSRLGKKKAGTYEISERFFNVWYLMRRATRRQRQDMMWLTRFMQVWFTRPELVQHARDFMRGLSAKESEQELAYGLALARALPNQTGEKLLQKIYERFIELVDGQVELLESKMGVNVDEIEAKAFDKHREQKANRLREEGLEALKAGDRKIASKLVEAFNLNSNDINNWNGLYLLYKNYNDGSTKLIDKAIDMMEENELERHQNNDYNEHSGIALYNRLKTLINLSKIHKITVALSFLPEYLIASSKLHLKDSGREIVDNCFDHSDELFSTDNLSESWYKSVAKIINMGLGEELQAVFRETGHDRIWRPFYEAIVALTRNSEDYLKTEVAAEVREIALQIFTYMREYNTAQSQVDNSTS